MTDTGPLAFWAGSRGRGEGLRARSAGGVCSSSECWTWKVCWALDYIAKELHHDGLIAFKENLTRRLK